MSDFFPSSAGYSIVTIAARFAQRHNGIAHAIDHLLNRKFVFIPLLVCYTKFTFLFDDAVFFLFVLYDSWFCREAKWIGGG